MFMVWKRKRSESRLIDIDSAAEFYGYGRIGLPPVFVLQTVRINLVGFARVSCRVLYQYKTE